MRVKRYMVMRTYHSSEFTKDEGFFECEAEAWRKVRELEEICRRDRIEMKDVVKGIVVYDSKRHRR